jgi:long-chain acyl-CoA synthetase
MKNYNNSKINHNINYNEKKVEKNKEKKTSNEYYNKNHINSEELITQCNKKTVYQELKQSFIKFSNREFLGYRKAKDAVSATGDYTYLTYSQVFNLSRNLCSEMIKRRLYSEKTFLEEEGEFKLVGIYSRNCVEWAITDFACQMNDVTSVGFYSTLGSDSFKHIFQETEISTIFVSPDNLTSFVEFYKQHNFNSLINVVLFDYTLFVSESKSELKQLKDLGLEVILFTELISEKTSKTNISNSTNTSIDTNTDSDNEVVFTEPKPDSILTLCYTSGTTSVPKGVKLTQKGFYTQLFLFDNAEITLTEEDSTYSYLPLAHVMERTHLAVATYKGMKISFISGKDPKLLYEEVKMIKPTILMFAPRVLVNFHQMVLNETLNYSTEEKELFDTALNIKRELYEFDNTIYNKKYDSQVFNKIRSKLGGNLKVILSGSAPLPKDISRDIKLFLSIPVIEGYGLTELHGASNTTSVKDFSNRNVGAVSRFLNFKLVDVPEMNYTSESKLDGLPAPSGEICFKGPALFSGYFRNKEKTDEVVDSEGWFHSGDVGMIDPINKGLKIVDRVKEIFKLSQGEYIAPAKLESAYIKSPLISQLCIYGKSENAFCIGIIVVNEINLMRRLNLTSLNSIVNDNKHEIETEINEKIISSEEVIKIYREEIEIIAKANGFNSLEKPKSLILTKEAFTSENQLLTPSMKLIRKNIEKCFKERIENIYITN